MIGGFHGNPTGFFNSLMSPHLFSSSGVSLVKTVSSLEVSQVETVLPLEASKGVLVMKNVG